MATLASFGGLDFESPTNVEDATAYFATRITDYSPPTERLTRWTYPGIDGQSVKMGGATPNTLRQVGWVEGATLASLNTAIAAVNALAVDHSADTLTLYDGAMSISNAIMASLRWTRFANYGGRYAAHYELTWESTG